MEYGKYYGLSRELFNLDKNSEFFLMEAEGKGMSKAGIKNKDLLLFKVTETPTVGSIVAAEVDGQVMCRKYIKTGTKTILRRVNDKNADLVVDNCIFKGELVSLVRNFG